MRATGIVRRIDDLGRIVVPKEIRRTLRIREGDPLEIFTDREGEIILKKYSPIGELGTFARQYAESLAQTLGNTVCVTDNDQVIAATGSGKKELQESNISQQLGRIIEERKSIVATAGDKNYTRIIAEQTEEYVNQAICPIICEGDAIGAVILLDKEHKKKMGETEQKLALCAAAFLGQQMAQ
ncbi:MAG: stage V sporulation protein T [Lachnospiraceae bacterium]